MPAGLHHSFTISFVVAALIIAGCGEPPRPIVDPVTGPPSSGSPSSDESSTQVDPAPIAEAGETNSESDMDSLEPLASSLVDRPVPDTKQTTLANQVEQSQLSDDQPRATSLLEPTSEELKHWAIPDYSPLQLLACYDDFSDGLVQALAVSPDGTKFALGGVRLTIWNVSESKPVIDLLESIAADQIERPIRSLAISPDGKLLAAGDQGGRLIVWDMQDLKQVYSIPKFAAIESKSNFASFGFSSYPARASLTEMEVALLKQFYALGWTAYSRLDASSTEDPASRRFSMLQGGCELSVAIGYPANTADEINVQVGARLTNKSLPIPPDCGLIEFDSSTNTKLVAMAKLSFEQTIKFYDNQLTQEGWQARDSSRRIKDGQAWLPFIRGQQDVVVRLEKLPDSRTRILVGEAEKNSWQLQPASPLDPAIAQAGIEAADFVIPHTATNVKYDSDQKQIQFELPDVTPLKLDVQYEQQLSKLEFKRDPSGVSSDEYVLATYNRGAAEIQLRARAVEVKSSTVIISGDGLLWTKAPPVPPVRISYETWLRRNHYDGTLDRLDEFSAEMLSIPDSVK